MDCLIKAVKTFFTTDCDKIVVRNCFSAEERVKILF